MQRTRNGWTKFAALAALASLAISVAAQDWKGYAGGSQRPGHSGVPTAVSGPGRSFLNWFSPNANDGIGTPTILDNTAATGITTTGVWNAPATIAEEAGNPFLPDLNTLPAYTYASTTASLSATEPEVPQIAGQHRTWQWQLDPVDGVPRNYALFVWLPIGPTGIGGVSTFQQRYFVYEVFYGSGQRQVQVVDTYLGGTGWVRLGNGGAATDRLYSYDGTTPIRIVLHNTVPRNPDGSLTDVVGSSLVYADAAMAFPTEGQYLASPIVSRFGLSALIHVVSAINQNVPLTTPTGTQIVTRARVTSRNFMTGAVRWSFTPDEVNSTTTVDNGAGSVTAAPAWLPPVSTLTNRIGPDYLDNGITLNAATRTGVTYAPTLDDGEYEIYAFLPGSDPPVLLGREVRYEILEGTGQTDVEVNQHAGGGWVRIAPGTFTHDATSGDPLTVTVTNFSSFPGDGARLAVADAIRFVKVSETNIAVNSTPLHATALIRKTPAGIPEETDVVIVAAENGKIYCLDANGVGGATQVYWTYPSTPDATNAGWTDPNHVAGEDGVGPVAEMPTGFDLSSALVERIGGVDYLYIGSSNGRVYCIEMTGRGDQNLPGNVPGTTRRVWTYPNDYPARSVPSNLGPFSGSLAFETTTAGPTIFAPTTQGRMFALDAVGGANKTTTVRWQFPAATARPNGPIIGTPAIAFGRIYYGTQVQNSDVGIFYALDIDTGAMDWNFFGSNLWGATLELQRADSFTAGPVAIPASEMIGMPNTVVVANDNRWITALDADTGNLLWTTDELAGVVVGNLSFTHQTVFNNGGALAPAPVVLVPVADGRIMSLFAETLRLNVFGGNSRLAWGFETDSGSMTSQVATGRNWMYSADGNGNLLGFSDSPGVVSPGTPPGRNVVPPNDPAGFPFREAKIKFVTKDTYDRLRLQTGAPLHLTHGQANNVARLVDEIGFEWGQTVYAMVYDFPYVLDEVGATLPSQVNYRFSVEGSSIRNLTVTAKQFSSPGSAPVVNVPGVGPVALDGYAITSFTIQGSGSTALPPGNAIATFTMSGQFSAGGRLQNVAVNPTTSRRQFAIANPISIVVGFNPDGSPASNYQIAYTVDPDDPEAAINGSFDITGTLKREDLLLSNIGSVAHGQRGTSRMAVVDRSLMTLLRGPGRGLDQIRFIRSDLAWQGGGAAVYKPINQLAYPLTEQLPINFPNDSLDYPNLTREFITVVKDRFGNAENPLYGGVSLIAPTAVGGGTIDPNNPLARTLPLTPVDIEVAVPKYQPANLTGVVDSNLSTVSAGYYGRMTVFVDSSGNGQLDARGRREANRTFWLGGSVPVDERIVIDTPVVDLGSLAQGTGYAPAAPGVDGDAFDPFGGAFQNLYKPFVIRNEGNVNLLNLRIAKGTNTGGAGSIQSWGLFAPANHERSWLDTRFSLWSDIDAVYALQYGGANNPLLQKPRPGDRSGSTFTASTTRRENAYLDVNQGKINPAYPEPAPARVGVTIPIGTPVGTYITTMRVIEDFNGDESLLVDANGNPREAYSDPTFTLRFNVRESRITNGNTVNTAPMIHTGLAGNENFLHKNVQPTGYRDQNGVLVVAFASTAPAFGTAQPADASTNDAYKVYIASLAGTLPGGVPGAQNSLKDLYGWSPETAGRWWRQSIGPLPNGPDDAIFASGPGESVLPGTAKYGAPAFPIMGRVHPLTNADMARTYLAVLGQAEKQTPTGRLSEARIMLFGILPGAPSGGGVSGPFVLPFDATMGKGRPAVIQSDDRATVFYAGSGTGSSSMFYAHFDGTSFAQPQPIPLGAGFESFGTPSISARTYVGLSVPGLTTNTPILEMTFSGKLRGRAHSEVYFARMRSDNRLVPVNVGGQRTPLVYFPRRSQERLAADGDGTSFSAAGLLWNTSDPTNNPVVLQQRIGAVVTNLEIPGTRTIDRTTGMISFETRIGGKAYLDPNLGSVRFSGTVPARNATILLSYTARVFRISTSGGSAYAGPNGLFDNRLIGEFSYWANRLNGAINPGDPVRTGRYIFTYGRAAAGAGAASRPYMRTVRFGVQLSRAIHTQANGNVTSFVVNNMSTAADAFYQVDPANGRVYFTDVNENHEVTITYTGVDETTGAPIGPIQETLTVGLIGERNEAPVPIEQAVNESQIFSFIDPLNPAPVADRRAGLIWMVYTSTRAGGPDVYIQSIAPKFTPVATGRG